MPNELSHHGILGQKWGIRRYQNVDGTLTEAGMKRQEKEAREQAKEDRREELKNRRTMSDDELKAKIERLKLESEYKKLTKQDLSPGKQYVAEILENSGKKVLTAAVSGAMAYTLRSIMETKANNGVKVWNWRDAASYMAPNPNKK